MNSKITMTLIKAVSHIAVLICLETQSTVEKKSMQLQVLGNAHSATKEIAGVNKTGACLLFFVFLFSYLFYSAREKKRVEGSVTLGNNLSFREGHFVQCCLITHVTR